VRTAARATRCPPPIAELRRAARGDGGQVGLPGT